MMPSVELIAVGTELLLGQLTDTNTGFIAKHLADAGLDVYATHAVGDNRARIAQSIRDALTRADGVITTGGLGPTVDDLTKEAVCDALGIESELHEASLLAMQAFFTSIGREMRDNNRRQAELPRGSRVLENPRGTAPGFLVFAENGKFVAGMPGVPREMKPMLSEVLIPLLRERYALNDAIYTRTIHAINLGESEIDHRIEDLFRSSENPKIAVLAHEAQCDVKVMAKADAAATAEQMIAPLAAQIKSRLEGHVYGVDAATIESTIHELLQSRGWRVATAESCTGGRIAAALTGTPGASKSFIGGVVAYDNAVKMGELGVAAATLERWGAVSAETALEMARGACARLHADIAIATTGIAGPDGGSEDKPVGLVCFAIATTEGATKSWTARFRGDRDGVQRRATVAALGSLWRWLDALPEPSLIGS